MKKALSLLVLIVFSLAIKAQVNKEDKLPEPLLKVMEQHGGMETWNKLKTLSYVLKEEKHTVDLHSRKTLVKAKEYSLGFDGNEIWVSDTKAFKKDPKFYYNLFFYFYAMPFVLADDGIIYSDVAPLVFEGVSYPGIKISYKANIGISPDDNYFIYYNPKTYQMEWLGYTVTYKTKKPSEKVKMIRYDDWEDVNGFLLPKSITWYKKDKTNGVLKPKGKVVEFSSASLSNEALNDAFYKKQ